MKTTYSRGYTLVEIIVIVGIIALVTAGGFGIYSIVRNADFDSQAQALLSDLREMQTKAKVVENDVQYGIAFTDDSWTTRSRPDGGAASDIETTELDDATLEADFDPPTTELYFARLSGKPVGGTEGTLTLTRTETGQIKRIVVKDTGVLYAE